jgi:SOS response regulatory protein OraA/RecX
MSAGAVRIVSLRETRPGQARIDLVLETGEAIRLHQRRLVGADLASGTVVCADGLAELRRHAAFDAAELRALHLIARRPRSWSELRERCTSWGLAEPAACDLVARLERIGAVDDRALRAALVHHRHESGHGRLRIEADMARLGVTGADGDTADDPEGEAERARRELERRFGARPTTAADIRRAAAHLARRGFDEDTVADVLQIVDT